MGMVCREGHSGKASPSVCRLRGLRGRKFLFAGGVVYDGTRG